MGHNSKPHGMDMPQDGEEKEGFQHLFASLSERLTLESGSIGHLARSAFGYGLSQALRVWVAIMSPTYASTLPSFLLNDSKRLLNIVLNARPTLQSSIFTSILCLAATIGLSSLCWMWRHNWVWLLWQITL